MIKAILIVWSLVLAFPAHAGSRIDGCLSDWGVSCQGMRVSICPQGDFESISDGCGTGNDYIWVRLYDKEGDPVAGVPVTDYWLQAADPAEELCLCANPIAADSLTNSMGRTTISGRIAGGGCAATGGLYLTVQGVTMWELPACMLPHLEDIIIVSPDLTADCRINLSDFTLFGFSYNKELGEPGYNPCCDFNDDDACNLSDFSFLGEHYYHACF